jgi:hypothetical protein
LEKQQPEAGWYEDVLNLNSKDSTLDNNWKKYNLLKKENKRKTQQHR